MKHRSTLLLALFAMSLTLPGFAQPATTPAPGAQAPTASPSAALTEGEVRKIDKEAGKITLKHGPLTNLEMPAMTMVFRVRDPAMLDKVRTGDKVRFAADKVGGALTITQIEPAQ